jgi:hypothetical protein
MPHKVQIASGKTNVELPDGSTHNAGDQVTLTDQQFSLIPGSLFTNGYLVDLGIVGPSGDAVTTQAPVVAAPAALTSAAPVALTSSQNATAAAATQSGSYVQADAQTIAALANALKTNYNAAQVDIAALRTNQGLMQADIAALRTTVAAILTALKTAGGPMAAS